MLKPWVVHVKLLSQIMAFEVGQLLVLHKMFVILEIQQEVI